MAALIYILTLIFVTAIFFILNLPPLLALVLVMCCWFAACLIEGFQRWKLKK